MPMAGKQSGDSARAKLRPGVTQSHRGRLVRNLTIMGLVVSFLFMVVSNSLNPKAEELSAEEQQQAEFEAQAQVNSEPSVEAAPANPFEVLRVATLPPDFESSESYKNLIASATETASALSTYSSKGSPEKYVASVPHLDEKMKKELTASAQRMWPEVKEAGVAVTGSDSGIDPVVRAFDEEASLATVEVVVKQTVHQQSDGSSGSQTRAYLLDLVGTENSKGDTTWVVGGFEKQ